jgi:hypothetical protein
MAYAPPKAANPDLGMFQNIIKVTGTNAAVTDVTSALSSTGALPPEAAAIAAGVKAFADLLPPSEIKDWLSKSPKQLFQDFIKVITGRKYTSGDYVLAERLNDQILGQGNIDRQQATDEMVDVAHWVFNQLFGVRIATSDDLDALDVGVAAYKAREQSKGISDNAINRAVWLKKNFYPNTTYTWDLKYFGMYPLVDRIPGYAPGTWYSGKVIGGGTALNGVIQLDADSILRQVANAQYSASGGLLNANILGSINTATLQKYAPFIAILLVLGVIISIKTGLFKPV